LRHPHLPAVLPARRAIGCAAAGPAVAGTAGVAIIALGLAALLAGCGRVPSSPNPRGAEGGNTLFTAFEERSPKYLDSTASYSQDQTSYTYSIYEPLYRFDYLKRPYQLAPRAAAVVVVPRLYDAAGKQLLADAPGDQVAESVYDIPIKRGIRYAPHPAFAKDGAGNYLYHHLGAAALAGKSRPQDFAIQGTRELMADDFVYAIRRLATPRIESPSFSTMAEVIVGMKEYGERVAAADKALRATLPPTARDLPFLDFRKYEMPGAVALDDHLLRIRVKGKYPQFGYWMQMTFFAPVAWEADAFYAQPGMADRNLSSNYWPVGTGPFMLTSYVENRSMTLERNPNFHGEPYPCEGELGDRAAGYLADCGKTMPFLDRIEFRIEKEKQAVYSKFMQGFYDIPISYRWDTGMKFDVDAKNSEEVASRLHERRIQLAKTLQISNWYIGFNWWDPVVGKGKTPEQQTRNRKLRQALSIAIDWEEYTRVFDTTASGEAAMGVVPPGVFGLRGGTDGINRVVYDVVDGKPVRKSIDAARALLAEAGYPGGRDAVSGKPLVLNYDFQRALNPAVKAELDWTSKQFAKLGIQLEIRATDYNRFQDKMNNGTEQIFFWGWDADYPDAENFLFLLYGPNSKAATHGNGENTANYQNDEFDRLFEKFKYQDDGPHKQALIDKMTRIVRDDAPWSFGYNPYAYGANHQWVYNVKPAPIIKDYLEYVRIDPEQRAATMAQWNQPIGWPLWLLGAGLALAVTPAVVAWRRRERMTAGRTLAPGATG